MDEAAWGALALTLSLLGGIYTFYAFRRRGLAAGMRGAGLTLLPVAAWLTDMLRLLTRIGDAVGDWTARLIFSPSVWLGVVVAGVAVTLLVLGGVLERRGIGVRKGAKKQVVSAKTREPLEPPASAPARSAVDDDLAEVEAILRKRGIS